MAVAPRPTADNEDKGSLIAVDAHGVAYIVGHRIKVRHIAIYVNQGLGAQEIHKAYSHLSMAQVDAALDYYLRHKAEIDADIERSNQEADEILAKYGTPLDRQALEERRQQAQTAEKPV